MVLLPVTHISGVVAGGSPQGDYLKWEEEKLQSHEGNLQLPLYLSLPPQEVAGEI